MKEKIFCLSLLLSLLSFPIRAEAADARERWYVFSIGETPVGYFVEEWNDLETRTDMSATLTRLGKSIEMRFETTAVETADGDLTSLIYEATLSKQPSRLEVKVEGDRIRILSPPHERFIERGIWGGHAWTEMIIDGRWVPMDAAVFGPGTASAARLAAGASSFSDGGGEIYAALGSLFGRVDIAVIEYESDRTIRLAADTAQYRVDKAAYTNPGLGLRVPLKDWAVEKADATWPSTLVVSFRRGGNLVELHHHPRNPERPLERKGDAMFVDSRGEMLWVWTASGPDAASALRQFLN